MNHTFPLDFTTFDKSDFDDLFFCLLKFPKQNPAQIYLSIILKFYNYPIFYSQLKASKAVATSNICHIVDHLFTFTPKICQHTHKQPGRGSFNKYVDIFFFPFLPPVCLSPCWLFLQWLNTKLGIFGPPTHLI